MSPGERQRRYELRLPRKPEPRAEEDELTEEEVRDLQKEGKPVDAENEEPRSADPPGPPVQARGKAPHAEVEITITIRIHE